MQDVVNTLPLKATYSPEDNKLRLYPSSRLSPETYARVKASGFIWAPKQELFVAPGWTPAREDLLLELCGEIGDEDYSPLLASTTADHAATMEAQRERFQRLADPASAPRVVSAFNLFQTPEPLAARMVGLLTEGRGIGRTLEPSAGLGRLYRAVRVLATRVPVVLLDSSLDCCRELRRASADDEHADTYCVDFLEMTTHRLGTFDSILANPPFCRGADITHIRHMLGLLRPTGRLVSLCADGPRQREQLQSLASQWLPLPPDIFRTEGTGVHAALVVIDGPNYFAENPKQQLTPGNLGV